MQATQRRVSKTKSEPEIETVYLPEGSFKAIYKWNRKIAFDDLYNFSKTTLEFMASKPGTPNDALFINAITDLEYGNHLNTERNLMTLGKYTSAKAMKATPNSEFLWEYLCATAMCGFILDDHIILELLYKYLKHSLYQNLVSETLILALNFDSKKCFSTLYKIQNGKFIWDGRPTKKIKLYISLKALAEPVAEIAKNGFSISNQTFFRYLKFLERQPQNTRLMYNILGNLGVFELSKQACTHCSNPTQFVAGDLFFKLDHTIQILLMKLALDSRVGCFAIDDIKNDESFGIVSDVSKHLSEITCTIGIEYQDIKRLINCISYIHTRLAEFTELDKFKFRDRSSSPFPEELQKEVSSVVIRSTHHLSHIKGINEIVSFAAKAAFKHTVDCTLYVDCINPRSQMDFLNRFCVALISEQDSFSVVERLSIESQQNAFYQASYS